MKKVLKEKDVKEKYSSNMILSERKSIFCSTKAERSV